MFISYAQESVDHVDRVRDLWIFLRQHGIDAKLDRVAAQRRQDWALWMADQVREADVVLCVASEQYRKRAEGREGPDVGRGVQWEARLIRDAFYAAQDDLQKFVPVVLPGQSRAGVPDFLAPSTSTVYSVADFTLDGAEELLRFLLDQPAETEPPLGTEPTFDRRDHAPASRPTRAPVDPRAGGVWQHAVASGSSVVVQAGRDVTQHIHVPTPPPSARGGDVVPLVVRVDSVRSAGGGWHHAFRRADAGAADVLARTGPLPRDVTGLDALLREQSTAGAYVLCDAGAPAVVVLGLHNPDERDLVVRDVTITGKQDEPVVDGTAFFIAAGVPDDAPATFDLDAAYPVARTDRVVVPALGQAALPLRFAAARAAHTFTVTLTYDCAGRSLSTTVDNGGRPFAVSPMIVGAGAPGYRQSFVVEQSGGGGPVLREVTEGGSPGAP